MNEHELLAWVIDLEAAERDYLLDLASQEHGTGIDLAAAQESRIVAISGWALVGIGTLAVANLVTLSASAQGLASLLAIAASVFVLLAGAYALWPRDAALGVSAQWYVGADLSSRPNMRVFALAALLRANEINDHVHGRRVAALKVMTSCLIAQVLLTVASVIASAA